MARPIRVAYEDAVYHVMARQYGYTDGSGVHRVLQRLEARSETDRALAAKLKTLRTSASNPNP